MKDRALIENVFWYGVELKELAQDALDALQEGRGEDCKRAIVDILRQVDLLNRRLHFFAGDEGIAHAGQDLGSDTRNQEGQARVLPGRPEASGAERPGQ